MQWSIGAADSSAERKEVLPEPGGPEITIDAEEPIAASVREWAYS